MEKEQNVEQEIFKDYMHNQFAKIEGFDFNDLTKLKDKLDKEVNLDIYPTYKEFFPKNNKELKILELGSGFGRFPFFCQRLGYKNFVGVDLSREGIEICRKLFPEFTFVEKDFNDYFSSSSEKFDIIFLAHVLEHVNKAGIPVFLENIKQRLNEGGVAIITVPNASAYFGATAGRYIDYTHEIAFTAESLEEILLVKGFKIVKSKNIEINVALYKKIIHSLVKSIFEMFIQIMGYKRERIYTQAFLTVAKK